MFLPNQLLVFLCYHYIGPIERSLHLLVLSSLQGASLVLQLAKNLSANAGDARYVGSVSGSGSFSGEGNGNLL